MKPEQELTELEALLDSDEPMTPEQIQAGVNRWYELTGEERTDIFAHGDVEIYCYGSHNERERQLWTKSR